MELELTANLKPKTSAMAADKKVAHRSCKVTFDDNPMQIGDLSRAGSFCDDCPADVEDEKMGMQAFTWSSDSVSYSKLPCVVINVESLETIPEANSSCISEVLIVDPKPVKVSTPPPPPPPPLPPPSPPPVVKSALSDILNDCKKIEVKMSWPTRFPSIHNPYPFINCSCGCDCPSTHSVGMETTKLEYIHKSTSYDLKASCKATGFHPDTKCQAIACHPETTCQAVECKPSTTCQETVCRPDTKCQATLCVPTTACKETSCNPHPETKCKATECTLVTACQSTCCDSDTCQATDDEYDSETQNEAIDSDPSEPVITELELRKVSHLASSGNGSSPCMHVVDIPNVVTVVIHNTSSPSTSCSYIANSPFFTDEKNLLHDADRSIKIRKMLMKQQELIALQNKEKKVKNSALKNYVLAPIRKLQKLADWAAS